MGRSRVGHAGERHNKDQEANVSIVPVGTDISFGINSQHFVLGYFHRVPPRPILFTYSQVSGWRRSAEGWAKRLWPFGQTDRWHLFKSLLTGFSRYQNERWPTLYQLTASPGTARSLPVEKHRSHRVAPNLATPAAFLSNGPD